MDGLHFRPRDRFPRTGPQSRLFPVALALLGGLAIARPALAQPQLRTIELVNGTDAPLVTVHLSPRDRKDWGPNRLDQPLAPQEVRAIAVMVNPEAGQCYYDLAAQGTVGMPMEAFDLNLCELGRYVIGPQGDR
jgi:hypothetical protein